MRTRALVFLAVLVVGCSNSNNSSKNDGDDTQNGPGDFSSVWQPASANLYVVDTANPTGGTQQDYDLPKTLTEANSGLEVESYVAFDASHIIRYAHYQGQNVYYRTSETAIVAGDSYITNTTQFSLDDGVLKQVGNGVLEHTDGAPGATDVFITLTYAPAQFPPSDWPTNVITYDEDAAQ